MSSEYSWFNWIDSILLTSVVDFDSYKMFQVTLCALFCIFLMKTSETNCEQYKTVDTHDGSVRGLLKTTAWKNVSYYSYKGIPYAEKPIGPLRFKVNLRVWNLKADNC